MAKFTIAIGDGVKGSGKTYKLQLEGDDCATLLGKKIGDKVTLAQTKDNTLEITGGSDVSGFPMRKDVEGVQKKKIFLASGVGYRPTREGCKDRKMVSGNTIGESTSQVNFRVVKQGKETLDKIFAAPVADEKAE